MILTVMNLEMVLVLSVPLGFISTMIEFAPRFQTIVEASTLEKENANFVMWDMP